MTILCVIFSLTVFLGLQWKNLSMTFTEANLLPQKHIVNQQYQDFLIKFGEEGNLIVIGFQVLVLLRSSMTQPKILNERTYQ